LIVVTLGAFKLKSTDTESRGRAGEVLVYLLGAWGFGAGVGGLIATAVGIYLQIRYNSDLFAILGSGFEALIIGYFVALWYGAVGVLIGVPIGGLFAGLLAVLTRIAKWYRFA
jgi:hypothetical protein